MLAFVLELFQLEHWSMRNIGRCGPVRGQCGPGSMRSGVLVRWLKPGSRNIPWIATSTVFRANVIKIGISYLYNVGSKHWTSSNPWYFTGSELKVWFTCLTIVGFKFVRMHKTYFWCQLWMHDACQIRSRIVIKRSPTVNIHPDHPLGRDNDIKPKDDFQIKKFPIMIFAKPGKPAFKYIYGFLSERRGYFRDL